MNRMVMTAVVLAVLSSGCGKDREPAETPMVEEISPEQVFFTDINMLEQEEGTAAVILRLREMLDLAEFTDIRGTIFDYLIFTYLKEERLEEAQELYVERGSNDAQLAEAGFGQIMNASLSDDAESSTAWLERIIAGTFPSPLRAVAWQNRMAIYANSGSIAPVAERANEILDGDLASSASSIFSAALSQGMRISDFDGVDAILQVMRAHSGKNEAQDKLVLVVNGDLLVARGQHDKALDYYLTNADALGDAELNRGFRKLLTAAQKQGQGEIVQKGVDAIYERGNDFPLTRDSVAAWTIDLAVRGGDARELLKITLKALDSGASVAKIYPVFSNGFYPAVQGASTELRGEILAMIERMLQTDGLPEHLQSMMGTALLDGAFFGNNFKAALVIVEKGVAGFDEAWHTELKDKINAHIALQEGRVDDAIALFRLHMKRVAAWEQPMTNPEDGSPVIKEVVLGFNEKRIGDILAGVAGRGKDATQAYAKAREHYQEALTLLDKDTPEYERAVAELAEVPSAE